MTMLFLSGLFDLECLLDSRSGLKTFMPRMKMWELLRDVEVLSLHQKRHQMIPGNKGEIDISAFGADEVFFAI